MPDDTKIKSYLNNGMTVGDLRQALQHYTDDTPVVFAYSASDHWRTKVAERVDAVDEGHVKWSSYHERPKVVELGEENEDDEKEIVAILR